MMGCGRYTELKIMKSELEIRDRLIGTWKLVSTEETLNDGSTRPFSGYGPHAQGFLMYQSDGYMCAVLEKLGDGAFAYCGRYQIDVEQEQIVHLPEVATDPEFVGSRQVRPYVFEGDRLIFSDSEKHDSSVSRWKIVWEKARQATDAEVT